MAKPRSYDIVLFGATGFVGRQAALYLAQKAHDLPDLRWAIAGRDRARLEALAASLHNAAAPPAVIVADALDPAALNRLAESARVVLSVAGPFARFGDALVDACVAQRTHYCDITGETPWVRRLIDRHHERAAADGTRLVPCSGFDSVPSDLGAWFLARALHERHGTQALRIEGVHRMRGGFNGGTLASALALFDAGDAARLAEPFLLNPAGTVPVDLRPHRDQTTPERDEETGAWRAPFFMGPVNTRVVRRSAGLLRGTQGSPYADDFAYREWLHLGHGMPGVAAAAAYGVATGGFALAARLPPTRRLLGRLKAPGEGPTPEQIERGSFRCDLRVLDGAGHKMFARVEGRGDPGNRATTIFVCESALALAVDALRLPGGAERGGLLTPAIAFGDVLVERLRAAGITFRLIDEGQGGQAAASQ
ncbi:saccharopine dehydrogenase family protein [Rivibacter subsaxonicus]|uniref:Short subunit dehydrogenase-like uncharacterized protein n=1 Tax=Rivibacter subsaxonicus TaxID=457575 RepID=A0A4Q7W2L6_9BURK|nr:saccharopine dehydrogenase NADP-binding domain-containing protein [Rivibacter subsaxonicus]RZU02919.1 short subunit dehydrogenase-like uncharacterized protein [Rivibacter subsaxonicus]